MMIILLRLAKRRWLVRRQTTPHSNPAFFLDLEEAGMGSYAMQGLLTSQGCDVMRRRL